MGPPTLGLGGANQMSFRFSLDKTIQAAGVLLRDAPGHQMTRLRLLKLLYIADRESLKETGRPITGDRVIAMKHGLVLSRTYNYIKGECSGLERWERYFVSEGFLVRMRKGTSVDELSPHEVQTLRRVSQERAHLDEWDIAEETHGYPEYEDPGGASVTIRFETILDAVGRGAQAKRILERGRASAAIDRLIEAAEEAVRQPEPAPEGAG